MFVPPRLVTARGALPRAMAGKRKPPPPEPDSEEDSEAYSDEEGLGLEAGGAGGSDLEDEEEEEEDAELEAEMAALESIRRDKLGGAGAPAKAHVYNKPGLEAAIEGTRTPPRPARGPSPARTLARAARTGERAGSRANPRPDEEGISRANA